MSRKVHQKISKANPIGWTELPQALQHLGDSGSFTSISGVRA